MTAEQEGDRDLAWRLQRAAEREFAGGGEREHRGRELATSTPVVAVDADDLVSVSQRFISRVATLRLVEPIGDPRA